MLAATASAVQLNLTLRLSSCFHERKSKRYRGYRAGISMKSFHSSPSRESHNTKLAHEIVKNLRPTASGRTAVVELEMYDCAGD